MNEELRRIRYNELRNKMDIIRSDIDSLISAQNDLISLLENNFTVNKKKIENSNLNEVKQTLNSINSNINNVLIPSINRKI